MHIAFYESRHRMILFRIYISMYWAKWSISKIFNANFDLNDLIQRLFLIEMTLNLYLKQKHMPYIVDFQKITDVRLQYKKRQSKIELSEWQKVKDLLQCNK